MNALPGIALSAAVALTAGIAATSIGTVLGYENSPVSAVLVAVVLGLVITNAVRLPASLSSGIDLCAGPLLRLGVALLGIRLSLLAVGRIGLVALPLVVVCITAALLLVRWLAARLELPPRLGSLIAAGTSICGITAIVAVAPVIGARDDETSYAVATIALFGLTTLLIYPFLAHVVFVTPEQVGLFLGTSIHDTAQVVGAALAYDQQYDAPRALDAAIVTKLLRNLSMIVVIPLMGILHARDGGGSAAGDSPDARRVPGFVIGFAAFALLRTVGDVGSRPFGVLSPGTWSVTVNGLETAATGALLLAMAAVGLRTRFAQLRRLGLRPFAVGLAAALTVGVVSATLILALAGFGVL